MAAGKVHNKPSFGDFNALRDNTIAKARFS